MNQLEKTKTLNELLDETNENFEEIKLNQSKTDHTFKQLVKVNDEILYIKTE